METRCVVLARLSQAFPQVTFRDATTAFQLQDKVMRCLDWVKASDDRVCLVEVNDETRIWQQIVYPVDEGQEGYLLFHQDSCFRLTEPLTRMLPKIDRFLRGGHHDRCSLCAAPANVTPVVIQCPACSQSTCAACFDAAKNIQPASKATFAASCPACHALMSEAPKDHRPIGFNL